MGMYTEILFRAELVRDVPVQVVDALIAMTDYRVVVPELPDHELFECSRWQNLGCGGSAYFPATESSIVQDTYDAQWSVFFLANLKDYSGETRKFFDWIDPYVQGPQGEFLGYTLYEEQDVPTLYFKESEPTYFRYDKDQYNYWRAKLGKEPV